jgi:hypothetical protein
MKTIADVLYKYLERDAIGQIMIIHCNNYKIVLKFVKQEYKERN